MTKELNCWELVVYGDFTAACEAADRDYSKTNRIYHLRNKAFALLNLQRFEETIALCSELTQKAPEGMSSDLIKTGVAFWLLGKPNEAVDAWRKQENAKYVDAAGGLTAPILILFAATSLDDGALREETVTRMVNLPEMRHRLGWPAPLGPYLLGLTTEEEMLAKVSTHPILRERQLCAAYFHIAATWLKKDSGRADRHMMLALQDCTSIMLEPQYYLAKGYLAERGIRKWSDSPFGAHV